MSEKKLMTQIYYSTDFRNFMKDLSFFCFDYVPEIKRYMCSKAMEIYENKTIVKMLHILRTETDEGLDEVTSDMMWMVKYPESNRLLKPVLHDPEHYRKVLEDLTFNEWWHKYNRKKEGGKEHDDAGN